MSLQILSYVCFVVGVYGHGRLTKPLSRIGSLQYEDDPIRNPGNVNEDFVCRHANKNEELPLEQVTAGSELTLQWKFGAAHVGDCAVYISYDVNQPLKDQQYFKIANLFDCKSQNKEDVTITLPDFLPAGPAILRWDWYALHVHPSIEFYSQCVDIDITATAKAIDKTTLVTYSIISPPIYPADSRGSGIGFRNAFNRNSEQFMTGPACACAFTGNSCELTKEGTRGYTGFGVGGCGGGGTTSPVPSPPPPTPPATNETTEETMTYYCEIYTVLQGDTMSKIADKFTSEGKEVTYQDICQINGKVDTCDFIDVGDNYVIPYKGSPCALTKDDAKGDLTVDEAAMHSPAVSGFVIAFVTMLAW